MNRKDDTTIKIKRSIYRTIAIILIPLLSGATCQPPGVVQLGREFDGQSIISVADVSGDGSILVGTMPPAETDAKQAFANSSPVQPDNRAFRWSAAAGVESIDNPSIIRSEAHAISTDGRVIVGNALMNEGNSAFRWTRESGMTSLGAFPDPISASYALDVSADGSVVVGRALVMSGGYKAFRWTAVNGYELIELPESDNPSGMGIRQRVAVLTVRVSDDGLTIIISTQTGSDIRAFRWTRETGAVALCDASGVQLNCKATGLSGDSRTIIGVIEEETTLPFRWTENEGLVLLDLLDETEPEGIPSDLSFDGSVIVGRTAAKNADNTKVYRAVIWDSVHGVRTVESVLRDEDAVQLENWSLVFAAMISSDGRTIAGYGRNPQGGNGDAWVVRLPASPVLLD